MHLNYYYWLSPRYTPRGHNTLRMVHAMSHWSQHQSFITNISIMYHFSYIYRAEVSKSYIILLMSHITKSVMKPKYLSF